MEIGTGIVVAAIIAIAAWQIDKRNAWGRAARVVLWAIGFVAVCGFGLWGYFSYEERVADSLRAKNIEVVREGKLAELQGVRLGMSLDEVEYLWGKAAKADDERSREWNTALHYKAVGLSDTGGVRLVACAAPVGSTYSDCSPVVGLDTYSSESDVLKVLGKPNVPPTFRKGLKFLTYGKRGGFFDVALKEGRVSAFVLYAEQKEFEVGADE